MHAEHPEVLSCILEIHQHFADACPNYISILGQKRTDLCRAYALQLQEDRETGERTVKCRVAGLDTCSNVNLFHESVCTVVEGSEAKTFTTSTGTGSTGPLATVTIRLPEKDVIIVGYVAKSQLPSGCEMLLSNASIRRLVEHGNVSMDQLIQQPAGQITVTLGETNEMRESRMRELALTSSKKAKMAKVKPKVVPTT